MSTSITARAANEYRNYKVAGLPASGDYEPQKAGLRALFTLIETALSGITAAGGATVFKATRANLNADLAHAADKVALVYADATADNNDFYLKVGSSGSGSWTKLGITISAALADQIAQVVAAYGDLEGNIQRAEAAEAAAELWASKPENQIVASGKYSALHYAAKSSQSAASSATAASTSTSSATVSIAKAAETVTAAAGAQTARAAAEAAAIAAGPVNGFYNTKAELNASLSGWLNGAVLDVYNDESVNNHYVRYRKVAGAAVQILDLTEKSSLATQSLAAQLRPTVNLVPDPAFTEGLTRYLIGSYYTGDLNATYATKAIMLAALSGWLDGALLRVTADESQLGQTTIYRKVAGAAVLLTAVFTVQRSEIWGAYITRSDPVVRLSGTHVVHTEEMRVYPGSTYTGTADLQILGGTGGSTYCDVIWYDIDREVISETGENIDTTQHDFDHNDQRRYAYAVTAEAPTGAAYARLRAVFQDLIGCSDIGVRRLKLEFGSVATQFTDDYTLLETADYVQLLKQSGPVDIRVFGVVLDGVKGATAALAHKGTDNTAALNAALASGRSLYWPDHGTGYALITDKLVFSTVDGQTITTANNRKCGLLIDHERYNMAASAIIELNGVGQCVDNLYMRFRQPNTSVKAELYQYPKPIDFSSVSRPRVTRNLIELAWDGIFGWGNVGGAYILDNEVCAFNRNLSIDGAADACWIQNFHCWCFGVGGDSNLLTLWLKGEHDILDIGRLDDFNISGILAFTGRSHFRPGIGGFASFGHITNMDVDATNAQLYVEAGEVSIGNLTVTRGDAHGKPGVVIGADANSSAKLSVTNLKPHHIDTTTADYDLITQNGGELLVANIFGKWWVRDKSLIKATAGYTQIVNGRIDVLGNTTHTAPIIDIAGTARAHLTGLTASDKGTGTGTFIRVVNDNFHRIEDNVALGWDFELPALSSRASGVYNNNSGVANTWNGGEYIGAVRRVRLPATGLGTFSGTTATVTHGISGLPDRALNVTAVVRDGAGSAPTVLPGVTYDGTNVYLTGGSNGRNWQIFMEITQ